MWPYFLVTGIIALAAVLFPRQAPNRVAWVAAFVMLVLFTGLRHKVGMDWNNYLYMAKYMQDKTLLQAMDRAEPGYVLLMWSSVKMGWGVYGANLVGAIIFTLGLFRCASVTRSPWLALLVAMPMLVVVVAMSANRQAVAIGVLLWLTAGWSQASLLKRVLVILLAASFHFSAVFFILFVALDIKIKIGPTVRLFVGLIMGVAAFAFLQYSGAMDRYDQLYVAGQTQLTHSSGATQHVLFNGIPALAVLLRGKWKDKILPNQILIRLAWVALLLVPLAFVFSAASGRMTLYLFPVSMYVFSGFTYLFGNIYARAAFRTCVAAFMVAVLAYWLNFANSSPAHVPYGNALFVDSTRLAL